MTNMEIMGMSCNAFANDAPQNLWKFKCSVLHSKIVFDKRYCWTFAKLSVAQLHASSTKCAQFAENWFSFGIWVLFSVAVNKIFCMLLVAIETVGFCNYNIDIFLSFASFVASLLIFESSILCCWKHFLLMIIFESHNKKNQMKNYSRNDRLRLKFVLYLRAVRVDLTYFNSIKRLIFLMEIVQKASLLCVRYFPLLFTIFRSILACFHKIRNFDWCQQKSRSRSRHQT